MSRKLKFQPGDLIVCKYNKGCVAKVERHVGYGEYLCTIAFYTREKKGYDLTIGTMIHRSSYDCEHYIDPLDDDLIWE